MPSDVPELTQEEQRLIGEHLDFYCALASGEREPTTEAQRRFVAVCEGGEKAETPHELAYVKYRRLAQPRPRPESDERPPWCSDAGWKRMRAGQYGDMMKRRRED